jgi:cytochrome c-type biogenesis protein CcmH
VLRPGGRRLALLGVAVAILLASPAPSAFASETHPTLAELETEVYCPTCHTPLALSSSPIAARMRQFIRGRIAAGDTKGEIKAALVDQFGEEVLAAPPKKGFNLLAWVLPLAGIVVGGGAIGVLAWRWTRAGRGGGVEAPGDPAANGHRPLDPELERRLDEELARFDG